MRGLYDVVLQGDGYFGVSRVFPTCCVLCFYWSRIAWVFNPSRCNAPGDRTRHKISSEGIEDARDGFVDRGQTNFSILQVFIYIRFAQLSTSWCKLINMRLGSWSVSLDKCKPKKNGNITREVSYSVWLIICNQRYLRLLCAQMLKRSKHNWNRSEEHGYLSVLMFISSHVRRGSDKNWETCRISSAFSTPGTRSPLSLQVFEPIFPMIRGWEILKWKNVGKKDSI